YKAISQAMDYVQNTGNLPVPLHLRNAPTRLMKDLNYGADYKYPHDFPGNFVEQNYFPEVDKKPVFYKPGKNANEDKWTKINRDTPS
ncbi:MAG: replication-associated recombination protein A, partial [Cytophagales bacterium]|nr:replication-associated recombination protein A [Cytophagales bacterium]